MPTVSGTVSKNKVIQVARFRSFRILVITNPGATVGSTGSGALKVKRYLDDPGGPNNENTYIVAKNTSLLVEGVEFDLSTDDELANWQITLPEEAAVYSPA